MLLGLVRPLVEGKGLEGAAPGPEACTCESAAALPSTPRNHFDDDISRAWALHATAVSTEASDAPLALDIGRVAVAFGVGALDAYLCDAFTDTLARRLKSCRRNGHGPPSGYSKLELPSAR